MDQMEDVSKSALLVQHLTSKTVTALLVSARSKSYSHQFAVW